jgi:hypothetical protein
VFNQTAGRQEVKRLTGNSWVPALVTDDGEVVQGSDKIIAWAKASAARATPANAPGAAAAPGSADATGGSDAPGAADATGGSDAPGAADAPETPTT